MLRTSRVYRWPLLPYNEGVAITILFFASIADRAKCRKLEVPSLPGDTVATVRDRMLEDLPQLRDFVPTLMYALNEEYVRENAPVPDGATLALIPPVSGGQMLIRVTDQELDPREAIAAVASPAAGAINLFLGVVRDNNLGRRVNYLVYEAYPSMAEKLMREVAEEAIARFGLEMCAVLHRTGRLEIGETSLLVAISSGHRAESFEAGHWIVNEVKKRVPVWKKEVWSDGESWIEGPESLGMQQAPAGLADR